MEDVLSVYQRPYDPKRPQVCLDEIQKALRTTPRGQIAMQPGQPRREDHEYQRHGKCSLFLAVEPLRGYRHAWVRERRTKLDFAEVLRDLVDVIYPEVDVIVLVVDNLNIHHTACLYERFDPVEARRIRLCMVAGLTLLNVNYLFSNANAYEPGYRISERSCRKFLLGKNAAIRWKAP